VSARKLSSKSLAIPDTSVLRLVSSVCCTHGTKISNNPSSGLLRAGDFGRAERENRDQ
jgi:hypothetical protein